MLFLLVISFSCTQKGGDFQVGILISSTALNRWETEAIFMKEKFEAEGGNVTIKSAENDENLQIAQALEMINSGANVLVINAVNGITAASIVRAAHDKGVKVIAYDRIIKNCDLDYFITFDGEKVGELIASYALKVKPSGNYVLMNGDKSDDNAIMFYNGTMKILQPQIDAKRINIVFSTFVEGYDKVNSAFYTDKVLEFANTRIDAILAPYDGLTDGIFSVLKKRGLIDSVATTGQDAEIGACQRIMNNQQLMTVYKPGKNMADRCAEMVLQIIRKEFIKDLKSVNNGRFDIPSLVLEPIAVDKENLAGTVVADGMYTMENIMSFDQNSILPN